MSMTSGPDPVGYKENLSNLVGAAHAKNMTEPSKFINPIYFVMPSLPRDVWYG